MGHHVLSEHRSRRERKGVMEFFFFIFNYLYCCNGVDAADDALELDAVR
jgi:hypothetical protein